MTQNEGTRRQIRKMGFGTIGAGKIVQALVYGVKKAGSIPMKDITVATPFEAELKWAADIGCGTTKCNLELIKKHHKILLAVKPDICASVLTEIGPKLTKDHLLFSVAAGLDIATIKKYVGPDVGVARVMYNTAIESGSGSSAFAMDYKHKKEDAEWLSGLYDPLGVCVQLKESLLNTATALIGSTPAYIYGVIEALSAGAIACGMPKDDAYKLAAQTVLASASLVKEKYGSCHPAELRDNVCSPGGSTIQGVLALEKAGYRAAFMESIISAVKKNEELAELSKKK